MTKNDVYIHGARYALEHGEMELFRVSARRKTQCKLAIEDSIRKHYANNCLQAEACTKQVVEEYGEKMTMFVCAVTIRSSPWDARYSDDNKKWAQQVPIHDVEGELRHACCRVMVHPGLLDLFVTAFRKYYPVSPESMA